MSEINVKFDTKEKTMEVTIDGKVLENVSGVYLGKSWKDNKDYSCEVCVCEDNDVESTSTLTRIVASESKQGQEITLFDVCEDLPGFKIVRDIAKKWDLKKISASIREMMNESK